MVSKLKFAVTALNIAQTLLVGSTAATYASSESSGCKCLPQDSCWPSDAEWNQLNKTTGGRLIKTVPPAAVCYAGPLYSKKSCEYVNQNFFNSSFFHIEDPSSIFYPSLANATCLPTTDPKNGTCTIGDYPVYVVNATSNADVQAGIEFAKKNNIRLVVKGTGHSFTGTSTGRGALSIWTRHIRQLDFHDSFVPKGCKSKGGKAVTIGAGETMVEIYTAANKKNVTVVGGADFSVGIGGFLTGGGHSPISSHYGLAAQQALEYEVVTADGEVVTASQCENEDLYYAMSGGGGSTFGVLSSVTVKTFDVPSVTFVTFNVSVTNSDDDTFWDMVAYFHTEIPRLVEGGLMGYYFVLDAPSAGLRGMMFVVHVVNQSKDYLVKLLQPLADKWSKAPYVVQPSDPISFLTFFDYWYTILISSQSVGDSTLLPSRLLPKRALSKENHDLLKSKLKAATDPSPNIRLLEGHLVAGPAVANNPNRAIGLNPAWLSAYVHLIAPITYPNDEPGRSQVWNLASNTSEYALRQLDPDGGAYLNEALPNEKNFQWSFFGAKYPRLHSIKQKYDPQAVFWCRGCVGSEVYIEQQDGSLCKAPKA